MASLVSGLRRALPVAVILLLFVTFTIQDPFSDHLSLTRRDQVLPPSLATVTTTPGTAPAVNNPPPASSPPLTPPAFPLHVDGEASDPLGSLYQCETIGTCQPCSDDEMNSPGAFPYCANTGRKQAVKCLWKEKVPPEKQDVTSLPRFQPCDQVKSVSRWAFFRFQFLNVFVAVLSCMTLIWRRRVLKLKKYRRLGLRPRRGSV
ncbi:hypothetical protein H4R33_001064 [Dimargaris cristalligena]|uniref:Uncharacterized protein n=1 Tax=Dimargaris cristalligena TaxID=215637 RepID=A0A4V1J4R2_9FUNG|nr:hypothetical protein H4R33_001064 [Dimargaris cristalligena]RKP36449.1 hypothetical protein BJ085DRAFT_34544 [Dimargaris cristalligena]|eukprot:RKP36449.1 hypothetical protein BJ085DRAFT_34544 [Dimargaris cristalligena]